MALTQQIALVPDGVAINSSELTRVASALSKQVQRDFAPAWKVQATVDAFARLEDVPSDYWPIIVTSNVEGAAGFHDDDNGQPFALVEFGSEWSLTASHECLEMLADPFGRRLRAGEMLPQAVKLGQPEHRVRYLVEVCDPSEGSEFAYHVNGILVSDFYFPEFFDPVAVAAKQYSFTGAITAPRTVLRDGYISWHDPVTDHWMQVRMFADELSNKIPHVVDLNTQTAFNSFIQAGASLRSAVDRVTKTPERVQKGTRQVAKAARSSARRTEDASSYCARMWRANIERLKAAAQSEAGAGPAGSRPSSRGRSAGGAGRGARKRGR
jgi:hypothetical protein